MATNPTYPGVYVEETPSGVRSITGASTSVAAFIGHAATGPLDLAVQIFSFGDYERSFGGLSTDSEMSYAVKQFYLNGGSQAWIVRVAKDAVQAAIALQADGGSPQAFAVTAKHSGIAGNKLRILIDYNTLDPDSTFNLTLEEWDEASQTSKILEVYNGLSMVATHLRYVETAINTQSQYIVLSGVPGGAKPASSGTLGVDMTLPGTGTFNNIDVGVTIQGVTDTVALDMTDLNTDASLAEVASYLQLKLRAAASGQSGKPELMNSVVTLIGLKLYIQTGPGYAETLLGFSDAGGGNEDAVSALGLDVGSYNNVQRYSLGSTTNLGSQSNGVSGSDGIMPLPSDIIGEESQRTGMYALDVVDGFNILCIPRTIQFSDTDSHFILGYALDYCKKRRAFMLVDPPSTVADLTAIQQYMNDLSSSSKDYGAIYFPHVSIADPLNDLRLRTMGASGSIAGLYARTDGARGIWKAPAGTDAALTGVRALSYKLTDAQCGVLNPLGINCLRSLPVYGRVVWGARTLKGADLYADQYKYVPIRRLSLNIEETLYRGLQWVVFEPNDDALWSQIRLNVSTFMHNLFRKGAFKGKSPREAYFVKCDRETTPQSDIDLGIVNVVVGFAPLKPAEFVIIQLQQIAGQLDV